MEPRNEKDLEYALADIITAKPHEIRIGRKVLRFYPVTLAKTFVLRRWMDALKIDVNLLQKSPYVECLRLVETQRDIITEILAVHSSPNTRKDLHDSRSRSVRRNLLASVKQEHLAALLLTMLTQDKTEELTDYLGIRSEHERLMEVLDVKREYSKNNLNFGGKSIFGAFIGQLKEMGYSDEEILFEHGYSYLRLMLADKVTSVYLSDEEMENLPQRAGGTLLDGETDEDMDQLASLIKAGGVKKPQK